jgi:hypothetical protein
MNDHVKEGGFVEASSGLLLIFAAGAILGPLIISPFMTLRTPYALFGWIAAFQLLLVVFTVWRMAVRERVPNSERNEFVESLHEIQLSSPCMRSKGSITAMVRRKKADQRTQARKITNDAIAASVRGVHRQCLWATLI